MAKVLMFIVIEYCINKKKSFWLYCMNCLLQTKQMKDGN